MAMNPYTPEAAQQKYPGAPQNQSRYPWRASGKSKPKPQQNTGGQQEAAPGPQKAPDMSMYSPGQAQPIQPQSQGTPYGAQPDGNYAYATPNNRPAPFTQRFTNFDGAQSEQPDFGRRDAFIQNINDSMLPYYGGQSQGAPQFDFQSMYRKAGDMVSNGWQNPFAMPAQPQQPSLEQQLSQYAPQTQYQPEVSRQSIMAPLTPEEQAKSAEARRSYWEEEEAWEKSGKPGYAAQPLTRTWDEVEALTGQNPKDNPIQKGTDWSSPYVQQFYREQLVNIQAEAKAREAWNAGRVRPGTAPPQYQPTSMPADPYARQPATSFYNPDEWQPERRRELQERARPLQQVNPATWTDQQWADYEAAQRTSGLADSGGYVRRDGKVFYHGGYGSRPGGGQEVTKDTVRDQYGLWRGAPSQPASMPADPYAQYRADDSGYMYPSPAGPPAFDRLYGYGTTEAWREAGSPKSAPRPGAAPFPAPMSVTRDLTPEMLLGTEGYARYKRGLNPITGQPDQLQY